MTAEAGNERAGRAHLRASHADREQVIGTLKAAFVQGRLTKDELDLRVSQTLTSRTYGDLAALSADLPTGLAGGQPPGRALPAQTQQPANKALLWGSWVVVLLTIGFMLGMLPTSAMAALVVGVLPLLIAGPVAGTLTLDAWRDKRSGGQLPPRAAQPGRVLEGDQDGEIGHGLILCEARADARARHLPDHGVIQRLWRSLPVRRAQRRPGRLTAAA